MMELKVDLWNMTGPDLEYVAGSLLRLAADKKQFAAQVLAAQAAEKAAHAAQAVPAPQPTTETTNEKV